MGRAVLVVADSSGLILSQIDPGLLIGEQHRFQINDPTQG
jgi:hypothetical protein